LETAPTEMTPGRCAVGNRTYQDDTGKMRGWKPRLPGWHRL